MQTEYDDLDFEDFDDLDPADDDRGREIRESVRAVSRRGVRPDAPGGAGLELIGGVLFLMGALPAAAVGLALYNGTNLTAEGLGGTAKLAAAAAAWVGAWPALIIATAIAAIGTTMVLGTLRTEPLRYVAGAAVSGLGLSAIFSAVTAGSGGTLGEGTGGALADAIGGTPGLCAGIILGLAVVAASMWLAFAQPSGALDDDDGFGPVHEGRDSADSSSMVRTVGASLGGALASVAASPAALKAKLGSRRREDESSLGGGPRRQRKIQSKRRRRANPVTLGDALAHRGSEGVSHDEAAALAPDDKTLAYMEDVWRRASDSFEQIEPIPPSPYPDDVRLSGSIPEGAQRLDPSKLKSAADADAAQGAAPMSASQVQAPQAAPHSALHPTSSFEVGVNDIAPFDFTDEISAPIPLADPPKVSAPQPPAPASAPRADDPFGTPGSLSSDEADALHAAVAREGASFTGPSELPPGVTPLVPGSKKADADPGVEDVAPAAASMNMPVLPGVAPLAAGPGSGSIDNYVAGDAAFDSRTTGHDPSTRQAVQAGAMPTQPSAPPTPTWEREDDDAVDLDEDVEIADVGPGGRWPRREEGESETEAAGDDPVGFEDSQEASTLAGLDAASLAADQLEKELIAFNAKELSEASIAAPVELVEEVLDATEDEVEEAEDDLEDDLEGGLEDELEDGDEEVVAEDEDVEEDAEVEEAEDVEAEAEEAEVEAAEDEDVEYEYVDEDGNPIDPAELGEEYELEDEDEDEDEEEDSEVAAEADDDEEDDEEAEEEEEEEYEYVDEDGNPISAEELEEGEYEYEEVEEDEEETADEEEETVASEVKGFADDDEYEEVEGDEDADEPEAAEAEETVILEPKARPAAGPAPAPEVPSDAASSNDGPQLLQAGRIFVREGRVAVSLLQRSFDLEFDAACEILDELQKEGLIGPYKGGKSRDILLTAEEWEGRFAHS